LKICIGLQYHHQKKKRKQKHKGELNKLVKKKMSIKTQNQKIQTVK